MSGSFASTGSKPVPNATVIGPSLIDCLVAADYALAQLDRLAPPLDGALLQDVHEWLDQLSERANAIQHNERKIHDK